MTFVWYVFNNLAEVCSVGSSLQPLTPQGRLDCTNCSGILLLFSESTQCRHQHSDEIQASVKRLSSSQFVKIKPHCAYIPCKWLCSISEVKCKRFLAHCCCSSLVWGPSQKRRAFGCCSLSTQALACMLHRQLNTVLTIYCGVVLRVMDWGPIVQGITKTWTKELTIHLCRLLLRDVNGHSPGAGFSLAWCSAQ